MLIGINVAVFALINIPLGNKGVDASSPLLAEYVRLLVDYGIPASQIRNIVAHSSALDLFLFSYGYKPAAPHLVSLFSSLFLHSGFLHLFGNMLFLYIYGDNVEHQLGRIRFLLMYLATGVIATLSFALLAGNSMTPLVGASGAISGVLGCYFFMFPKNKIKIFILLFPIFMNIIRIPARLVLAIYVIVDNLLPLLMQTGGNVAHGAHLGGFIGGLGIAALGKYFNRHLTPPDRQAERRSQERQRTSRPFQDLPFSAQIEYAVNNNEVILLRQLLQKSQRAQLASLDTTLLLKVVRFLKDNGGIEQADKLIKFAITTNTYSHRLAEFYFELGDNRLKEGSATAAYQHFLTALDLQPPADIEQKIRSLLQYIVT